MAMVYFAEEKNIYIDGRRKAKLIIFSINWTYVKLVYS